MPALDFSALTKIAQQGFNTEQDKDSLLDQGFTILPGEPTPFEPPAAAEDPPQGSPAPQPPPMSEYKRAFRIAFDYLEQHLPPQNTPEWWTAAAQGISAIYNQANRSPFLQALLTAVYGELERIIRDQAAEKEN